ncbi:MAG: aminotransferase class V-fold PLP-dependent enzyme [Gammaproteobacteria bacterium]|nr:aminotransferase class V-fold PLP-dependent enzyme [Gammaproteobacteria bacterium]MCZ6486832.1 aminotransferase class V-fold PLP-dependent enzyme [Gammaproteobacteria bacterium]MCZ6798142.1 aminotransferase class V-fold PLP-dependent enzyme [Gammaproteobacteria bacterium]MCZ6882105.1 aminotransferase class V-fold PLP-dependent enzyme [Gammaproteobacteria bacterium]
MSDSSLLQTIQDSFIGRDTIYPMADGSSGPRHYLDSAASTLMMRPAFEVAQDFLAHYASTHSDLHYAARGASHAYEWAHERVLAFVGADPDIYSVYFTGSGATAGFNRIAAELAAQRPERDVVLVSEMEHHSNDLPHRKHSRLVVHMPLMGEAPAYGGLDLDVVSEYVQKHSEKINYIAITGASNVTGSLTPLHELAQLAHSVGAYLVVDASQMIAHAPVSMQNKSIDDADIDVLVFSGHKIYAPGSPGAVIAKRSLLAEMPPAEVGGGMVDDVYLTSFTPSEILPDREEAGTPNIVGAITLGAVLDILLKIGMDNIRAKEIKLIDMVWEKLSAIDGVNLYGPAPSDVPRTGTIPFNIQGFDHGLTAAALNDYHNIQVRNGCFCAHPYVREILKPELWAMDIDPDAPNSEEQVERKRGMARASLGIYTTEADLLALVEAVADLVARKEEILATYEPVGKNSYRHRQFSPDDGVLFNPETSLQQALGKCGWCYRELF